MPTETGRNASPAETPEDRATEMGNPSSKRRPKRLWRYRVERAWGSWESRIKVGTVVVDRYYGKSHHWNFIDLATCKETGGFYAVLIGEHKGTISVGK